MDVPTASPSRESRLTDAECRRVGQHLKRAALKSKCDISEPRARPRAFRSFARESSLEGKREQLLRRLGVLRSLPVASLYARHAIEVCNKALELLERDRSVVLWMSQ